MNKKTFLVSLFWFNVFLANPQDAAKLVNLRTVISGIHIDCIYATTRNFTGVVIYKEPKCYLLKEVADQLKKVEAELNKKGYGLLIWDAFRPMEVQKILYRASPDRGVYPPHKGGKHTRGTAVDLTIIRLVDNKPLEMPTEFDDFSEKAASNYQGCSQIAKQNRKMLQDIMAKYGFKPLKSEWWHFDYKGWKEYPPLDVTFGELN